ncbi:MAG: 16S rRNA (uracil(1498)-N(3))-methyltransferase [Victivallaceae bacterium]|nr:RsmE family RNA methyltransferase [Victivallaceae bacterium]
MNILLLEPSDLTAPDRAFISGERAAHLLKVLKKRPGEICKAGLLGGLLGTAEILCCTDDGVELRLCLDTLPPEPVNVTLACALPRPKVFRRLLAGAAAVGVREFHFFGCFKVEKSYWESPLIAPESIAAIEREALAQCVDTAPVKVEFHRFFKPFAEDVLPDIAAGKRLLVCHPSPDAGLPAKTAGAPVLLCFGPEGGFTDYELEMLVAAGGTNVSLGPRILRCETAVPFALGRIL